LNFLKGDPNTYHNARARANHEHRSRASQPALFVHSVVTRPGKEEVRNAETQEGYGEVQKNAREGAAVGWRFCGLCSDVLWQGFIGTEVLLAPLG
jgi:hypothetical protein